MDREDAIKLLTGGQEGDEKWNQWRKAHEGRPNLGDLGLGEIRDEALMGHGVTNAYLVTRNLARINRISANLVHADLSGADLSGANLASALLVLANLRRANLVHTYLTDADLTGADLSSAFLALANLQCAYLASAQLRDANLHCADLRRADLTGADLTGANLKNAALHSAKLRRANLTRSDLTEALLDDADLSGADLTGADLTGASCNLTVFANLDLTMTVGLDRIEHLGPSTLGSDTLFRSKGKIPEVFLRGCGVPDSLIQSLPLILNSMEPIQFYSCFISYSSKNQDFAERLHADLQAKGVRTWFDREDFKIGDKIRHGINEAIRVHDKLMLVLTEHSIASDWVEGEVESALEREQREKRTVLFPLRLDDAVMETSVAWASHIRRTRHTGDFREWENNTAYQIAFARLLRDLKSVESIGAGAHTPPATSP